MKTLQAIDTTSSAAHYVPNSTSATGFNEPLTMQDRTAARDFNDWLEEQDEAEVACLVAQITAHHHRANRMSAYG